MKNRTQTILNHDFFIDKQDLAEQIIQFEDLNKGVLPNVFRKKEIPSTAYNFGNKPVTLGRIENFYYFGVEVTDGTWKYQAFENESKCKKFFIDITEEEKALDVRAFWLGQIARLVF